MARAPRTAWASDLGWAPGAWPKAFLHEETRQVLTFWRWQYDLTGEDVVAALYASTDYAVVLTVYND